MRETVSHDLVSCDTKSEVVELKEKLVWGPVYMIYNVLSACKSMYSGTLEEEEEEEGGGREGEGVGGERKGPLT